MVTFLHVVMWCDSNEVFHSRERIAITPLPDPAKGQLLLPPRQIVKPLPDPTDDNFSEGPECFDPAWEDDRDRYDIAFSNDDRYDGPVGVFEGYGE